MSHEKTASVSKIGLLLGPLEEDETPRNNLSPLCLFSFLLAMSPPSKKDANIVVSV